MTEEQGTYTAGCTLDELTEAVVMLIQREVPRIDALERQAEGGGELRRIADALADIAASLDTLASATVDIGDGERAVTVRGYSR